MTTKELLWVIISFFLVILGVFIYVNDFFFEPANGLIWICLSVIQLLLPSALERMFADRQKRRGIGYSLGLLIFLIILFLPTYTLKQPPPSGDLQGLQWIANIAVFLIQMIIAAIGLISGRKMAGEKVMRYGFYFAITLIVILVLIWIPEFLRLAGIL